MPEQDISSLCMWVSWGWTAWKYCSRHVAVVAQILMYMYILYIHTYIYMFIFTHTYIHAYIHYMGPGRARAHVMYICMHICMGIYKYVYMYVHIIYKYTLVFGRRRRRAENNISRLSNPKTPTCTGIKYPVRASNPSLLSTYVGPYVYTDGVHT